jgi:hypothetical protein
MPSAWAILAVSATVAPTLVACLPSMVAKTIVPFAVLPAMVRGCRAKKLADPLGTTIFPAFVNRYRPVTP